MSKKNNRRGICPAYLFYCLLSLARVFSITRRSICYGGKGDTAVGNGRLCDDPWQALQQPLASLATTHRRHWNNPITNTTTNEWRYWDRRRDKIYYGKTVRLPVVEGRSTRSRRKTKEDPAQCRAFLKNIFEGILSFFSLSNNFERNFYLHFLVQLNICNIVANLFYCILNGDDLAVNFNTQLSQLVSHLHSAN